MAGPNPLLSPPLTFPEVNQVRIHCWVDSKSFPVFGPSGAWTCDLLHHSQAFYPLDQGASHQIMHYYMQSNILKCSDILSYFNQHIFVPIQPTHFRFTFSFLLCTILVIYQKLRARLGNRKTVSSWSLLIFLLCKCLELRCHNQRSHKICVINV